MTGLPSSQTTSLTAQTPPASRRRQKQKQNICTTCRRTFRRAEHLSRHVLTHTKERPFACHCRLTFTRRDLLRRHEQIAHPSNPDVNNGEDTSQPKVQQHPRDTSSVAASQEPEPPCLNYHHVISPRSTLSLKESHNFDVSPALHANGASYVAAGNFNESSTSQLLAVPRGSEEIPENYDMNDQDHVQDFVDFVDSMGLPIDWNSVEADTSYQDDDLPTYIGPSTLADGLQASGNEETRLASPFRPWFPSIRPGDCDQPMEQQGVPSFTITKNLTASESIPDSLQPKLSITESQRRQIGASLSPFRHVVPDFMLPSRHTLTRYIVSFFEGFHMHMPFMHLPTWKPDMVLPELLLAIVTLGAQYRFERTNAGSLFYAAKAVVLERIREWENTETHRFSDTDPGGLGCYPESSSEPRMSCQQGEKRQCPVDQIEAIQALFFLMAFATWENTDLLREAIGFQTILVRLLRRVGLNDGNNPLTWQQWAQAEVARRTKLVSFCFLNIHTIAYNTPPVLLSSELNMCLPCTTKEWNARSSTAWEAAKQSITTQLNFQEALSRLLRNDKRAIDPVPSPLGNYIVLHGLLQRIYLVRELSLPLADASTPMPPVERDRLESALYCWTTAWKQAPESSLDPLNPNGPIPFTSSALSGLAFVRLHLNLGPHRLLDTRDPAVIANALFRSPPLERSPRLIPALMYSVHALSIPVRLGIDYVARSQAFFWSVRHSLASFECAVLLSKWLCHALESKGARLSEEEARIYSWVERTVEEAWSAIDGDSEGQVENPQPFDLGFAAVKIWARIFKHNVQWPLINIMGLSLEIYAGKLVDNR